MSGPGLDRTRTLRGAVSGALAATVWALQQPLDKRVFGCDYDDVELLGKAVTRGDGWFAIGLAMHVGNGAAFGVAYANLAPAVPLPPMARAPAAALLEHLAGWPLVGLTDRLHPARRELPVLAGNRRAFAQATWRHLLFGVLLGVIEQALDPGPETAPVEPEVDYSQNGHGRIEHAVTVGGTPSSSGDS